MSYSVNQLPNKLEWGRESDRVWRKRTYGKRQGGGAEITNLKKQRKLMDCGHVMGNS